MIRHLKDKYAVRDLMILDDNFILNRKKLFAVCDQMIGEKLDISWYCMGHARFMSEDRLKKIKSAGCWFIEIGIESGCDRILQSIKKNTTKSEIAEAVKRARKIGLKTKGNFIFGFPSETRESLEETIRFASSIGLSYFQQNFLTAWPGCEIANNVDGSEISLKDWGTLAHQRVTYIPEDLTPEDLIRASKQAFRRFYLRPAIMLEMLSTLNSWWRLKSLLIAGLVFLKTIRRKS